MTKKHFTLVADGFRRALANADSPQAVSAIASAIAEVAIELGATNPRFDRVRFVDYATGIREKP